MQASICAVFTLLLQCGWCIEGALSRSAHYLHSLGWPKRSLSSQWRSEYLTSPSASTVTHTYQHTSILVSTDKTNLTNRFLHACVPTSSSHSYTNKDSWWLYVQILIISLLRHLCMKHTPHGIVECRNMENGLVAWGKGTFSLATSV